MGSRRPQTTIPEDLDVEQKPRRRADDETDERENRMGKESFEET